MNHYLTSLADQNSEDKRLEQQAQMQSNSQKQAVVADEKGVPTLEQMAEKPPDDGNGPLLSTAEIIDFAAGSDSYL
ncbi:MAG: hypothetical protein ACK5L0_02040 [Candidatus Fimivivens sp.]